MSALAGAVCTRAPQPLVQPAADRHSAGQVLLASERTPGLPVLIDALEESGYSVVLESTGEAALRAAAHQRPDIVLVEASLPDIEGFELLRRLKADPATSALPLLFVTAQTDAEHLMTALEAGAADCVTKPVTAALEFCGMADMGRGPKAGFEAQFTIKRSEFGVNYGVEKGAIGDEVRVVVGLEGGPKK